MPAETGRTPAARLEAETAGSGADTVGRESGPAPARERRFDGRELRGLGAALGLVILLLGWLLPPQAGLQPEAQQALALILFTICWCAFGVVPEGLAALFFILIGIGSGLAPAGTLLLGWTDPVMWFNIAAFGVGFAFQGTGLGRRLALLLITRTGIRYARLIGAVFAVNALFSLGGLSSAARVAILLPVLAGMAAAAGLRPEDRGYRGLVIAAVSSSTLGGLLLLAGAGLNPVAMLLAGGPVLYSRWLLLFSPVAAVMMLAMALAVIAVWRPARPLRADAGRLARELSELGGLSGPERRLLGVLGLMLLLWNLDFLHGIHSGWIALLAAALLAAPGIGVMRFDEFTRACNWNVIFFIAAMLGISHLLVHTGLDDWLAGRLLAIPLPEAAPGLFLALGLLAVLVHVPSGSSLASMSVLIPATAAYGSRFGYRPEIVAFLVHALLWSQFFFPYQHIASLYALGRPGFRQEDLYRYGLLSTAVLLGVVLLCGIPYWSLLGVLHQ